MASPKIKKMKIYTYYEYINDHHQPRLIDLWKISWERQGYEPIVLNLEHAKKHPYFETFNSEMRRIFKEIKDTEISEYGMSCWFRWLAYATQPEEKFYVSDYDAINANFPITEPSDKLHLLDGDCPFLVSGTPKQFESLCKAFVEVSNRRLEIIRENIVKHYHDQEFFINNSDELKYYVDFLKTRDRSHNGGIGCWYIPNDESRPSPTTFGVYHVSHTNVVAYLDSINASDKDRRLPIDHFRILLMKDLLNIK